MHRYLSLFLLGAALLAPVAVRADNHNQTKRYYDRDGRDYHEWNQNEQRAYNRYLEEQHRRARIELSNRRRDQQQYFKWRHSHSDALLRIEVR